MQGNGQVNQLELESDESEIEVPLPLTDTSRVGYIYIFQFPSFSYGIVKVHGSIIEVQSLKLSDIVRGMGEMGNAGFVYVGRFHCRACV